MAGNNRSVVVWNGLVACLCLYNIGVKHSAGNYDLWFGISIAVLSWCLVDLFKVWRMRR